jgi:hypothetical protein
MRFVGLACVVACSAGTVEPRRQAPTPPPPPSPPIAEPARAPVCEATQQPSARPRGHYGFGSHRRETGENVCQPADDNLTRVEDALLARADPAPATTTVASRKATPVGLDAIARRFGLDAAERKRIAQNGFAVFDRLEQPSYAWAYHDIYQSQLPLYISVDSILHALYAAHDHLLGKLERAELAPKLRAMTSALHCALATAGFAPETARDLDLYLAVGRSLLENRAVASALGDATTTRAAAELVALARAAGPMKTVELFGRPRVIDFSQYQPRGHYVDDPPYFRGFMWLSRIEWNLVSRGSRSSAPSLDRDETPREAIDALALAELVGIAREADHLDEIEHALAVLAGRREDVSVAQLRGFAIDPHADDPAAKLRAAIGDKFQRTARIHFAPEGAGTLPAIATLLGPRIVADTSALRPLANSETRGRERVRAGDLAFIAGNDRGKLYLRDDLAQFPELARNLDAAREIVQTAPRTPDLYTAWLDAIRALAIEPRGALPAFMRTPAFADLRLDSTIAAFAQIRHDHVLIAGQAYGEGGCEIPDGYVEPAPDVYDAIARYAELGAGALPAARGYFERLGKIARVLARIARIELAGQPLPVEAKQFLSMVVEILPYGSDGRPTYTGWYFDLFDEREDAISHADLVADYFTSSSTGGAAYVGVRAPALGVFVVDTGGAPRAMIGPVARAYEYASTTTPRLDDAAAAALPESAREAAWTASYSVAGPPEPSFVAWADWNEQGVFGVKLNAAEPLGTVTVQVLDHHRVASAPSVARTIGKGKTFVAVPVPKAKGDSARAGFEMIHLRTGNGFQTWIELACSNGCRPAFFGATRADIAKWSPE